MINKSVTSNFSEKLQEQITYALNMMNSNTGGDRGAKTSEPGYYKIDDIFSQYLGHIVGDDEIYIFLQRGVLLGIKGDTVVEYFKDESLTFSTPIDATFRVKNGCERIIYWVDGVNPDRFINLDRLDLFIDENGNVLKDKIELSPNVFKPNITDLTFNTYGGTLEYGAYSFVVELLDESKNIIKRSDRSQWVYTEGLGEAGFNISNTAATIGGKPMLNGSINLMVDSIDTDFTYIQLSVIKKSAGDGLTQTARRLSNLYVINGESLNITFTGVEDGDELVDFRELLTPIISYKTSKTIEQVQNRLVRANLKESTNQWGEFQKFASKVGVSYKAVQDQKTTFLPDSVIPLGIVYQMADGTESPPFPLIGTPTNIDPETCEEVNPDGSTATNCLKVEIQALGTQPTNNRLEIRVEYLKDGEPQMYTDSFIFSYAEDGIPEFISLSIDCGNITEPQLIIVDDENVDILDTEVIQVPVTVQSSFEGYAPLNGWDDTVYPTWNPEMTHLLSEQTYKQLAGDLYGKNDIDSLNALKEIKNLPKRSDIFNTATIRQFGNTYEGRLGHYASKDFTYNTPTGYCEGDYWGTDICGNQIEGENIRHFRMPSRKIVPDGLGIQLNFFNVSYPDGVIGHYFVQGESEMIEDTGYIKPLKVEDDGIFSDHLISADDDDVVGQTTRFALYTPTGLVNSVGINAIQLKILSNHFHSYQWFEEGEDLSGDGNDLKVRHRAITVSDLTLPAIEVNFKIEKNLNLAPSTFFADEDNSYFNISQANYVNIIEIDRAPIIATKMMKVALLNPARNLYTNLDAIEWFRIDDGYIRDENDVTLSSQEGYMSDFKLTNYNFIGRTGSGFGAVVGALTGGLLGGLYKGKYKDVLDPLFSSTSAGGNDEILFGTEYLEGLTIDSKYNWDWRVNGTGRYITFPYGLPDNSSLELDDYRESVLRYFQGKLLDYDQEAKQFIYTEPPYPEYYLYNPDYLFSPPQTKFSIPLTFNFCSDCFNEFPNRIIFSDVSTDEDLQDFYRVTLANNFSNISSNKGPITKITYYGDKLFVHTPYTTYLKKPNPQVLSTNEANVFIGTGEFLSIPEVELRETSTGYAGLSNLYAAQINEFGYQWIDGLRGQIFNYSDKLDILHIDDDEWFKRNLSTNTKVGYDPYYKRFFVFDSGYCRSYDLLQRQWSSFHTYRPQALVNNTDTYYFVGRVAINRFVKDSMFGQYGGNREPSVIEVSIPLVQTSYLDSIYYIADFEIKDDDWHPVSDTNFKQIWCYNDTQSTGLQPIVQKIGEFDNVDTKVSVITTDKNHKISQLWDVANGQKIYNGSDYNKEPINYEQNQFNIGRLRGKYVKVRLYFNDERDVRATMHLLSVNNAPSIR